jgi:hypothetical protein
MNTNHALLSTATPVALISACGLIILALYNRLSAIHARIRIFHQQKIDLLASPVNDNSESAQTLLDMIDSQIVEVTVKARAIQKGLYCQLGAVLVFLLCSSLITISAFFEQIPLVAIGLQAVGLLLFACGIGFAIQELSLSLTPLEEESAYLKTLASHHQQNKKSEPKIRVTKAA